MMLSRLVGYNKNTLTIKSRFGIIFKRVMTRTT